MTPPAPANRGGPKSPEATILVVDDQQPNLDLLEALLEAEGYRVLTASTGERALEIALEAAPDAVLLDVMMPGMDGFEACRRLKADPRTRRVPVVLVTALVEDKDRISGYESEADDFLTKPVSRPVLLARVRNLVRLKTLHDHMEDMEAVIYTLAATVEAKDKNTQGHVYRMARYCEWLAAAAGTGVEPAVVRAGAILHDIGKIGIPEAILCKQGRLTSREYAVMKRHPEIGARICRKLHNAPVIVPMVLHHHERWDGGGYPDGLAGEAIPLTARIVSIADSFDAMVADRVYHKGVPWDEALALLAEGAGTQWDPRLAGIFVELMRDREREKELRLLERDAEEERLHVDCEEDREEDLAA